VPLLHRLREWPKPVQSTVTLTGQLTTDYFHAENFEGVGQGTSEYLFSFLRQVLIRPRAPFMPQPWLE
jgi:hypothetical protein